MGHQKCLAVNEDVIVYCYVLVNTPYDFLRVNLYMAIKLVNFYRENACCLSIGNRHLTTMRFM